MGGVLKYRDPCTGMALGEKCLVHIVPYYTNKSKQVEGDYKNHIRAELHVLHSESCKILNNFASQHVYF